MDNEEDIELNTLFNSIWKKLITYNISSNKSEFDEPIKLLTNVIHMVDVLIMFVEFGLH